MMSLCKYWFQFHVAPPEVIQKVQQLKEQGYNPRKNNDGETVVSAMFLMHCEAATVSFIFC